MRKAVSLCIVLWALVAVPLFGSTLGEGAAKNLVQRYGERLLAGDFSVSELFGDLYIKEYVDVEKRNLALNLIPGLARFDSSGKNYLSEFFYEVHYVKGAVPDIRRVAHLTSFKRGSGEIERVMYYVSPDFLKEKIFKGQYLSPVHPANYKYYRYALDTLYAATDGSCKIKFEQRFDNIKLIDKGWVLITDSCAVRAASFEGWDEQSRFVVTCTMGNEGLERFVVKDINVLIDYKFAYNRLKISASATYSYFALSNELQGFDKKRHFDVTGSLNTNWSNNYKGPSTLYATLHRATPLTSADSLVYLEKEKAKKRAAASVKRSKSEPQGVGDKVTKWLWELGDGMTSSHSLNWGESNVKMYPLVNPSYLRYSSDDGVTYKLAMNLKSRVNGKYPLYMKPVLGYSFKRKEFYWSVKGNYVYNLRKQGVLSLGVSREKSIYRKVEVEKFKELDFSQVVFRENALNYYRDTRVRLNAQRELFNGFDIHLGATFYYRSMRGDAVGEVVEGEVVPRKYKNFAPMLQLVWHPGMYHYYDGDNKVNLGSHLPRFSLNVEQGIRGFLKSTGVYTRAELDVQHKMALAGSSFLFTRVGAGGYLYDKDVAFISYAFLKDNILPLDKDDELKGVFQLLDAEWYNSANRYFRANATYVSPFLLLNKIVPGARIFKNEMLFFNALFMSKLCPYTEFGYGVETPYVNVGGFVAFDNFSFHKIGCKITVSLFGD